MYFETISGLSNRKLIVSNEKDQSVNLMGSYKYSYFIYPKPPTKPEIHFEAISGLSNRQIMLSNEKDQNLNLIGL